MTLNLLSVCDGKYLCGGFEFICNSLSEIVHQNDMKTRNRRSTFHRSSVNGITRFPENTHANLRQDQKPYSLPGVVVASWGTPSSSVDFLHAIHSIPYRGAAPGRNESGKKYHRTQGRDGRPSISRADSFIGSPCLGR